MSEESTVFTLCWVTNQPMTTSGSLFFICFVASEVLRVIQKNRRTILLAQCLVDIKSLPPQFHFCYILVSTSSLFLHKQNETKGTQRHRLCSDRVLHVATGNCLRPRVSQRSPAERLFRWSPPAGPPLEGSLLCPVTWSPSLPLVQQSLQGSLTARQ